MSVNLSETKAAKKASPLPAKKAMQGPAEEAPGKLKQKDYDKELARLHVELVKLQDWVVQKGLKVCILFEGRDGAGKGGTIKAITETVSPRVFRVVALPTPTDREKSQMFLQRYVPHLASAVVGSGREEFTPAGCHDTQARANETLLTRIQL